MSHKMVEYPSIGKSDVMEHTYRAALAFQATVIEKNVNGNTVVLKHFDSKRDPSYSKALNIFSGTSAVVLLFIYRD